MGILYSTVKINNAPNPIQFKSESKEESERLPATFKMQLILG
jgi:hypothetical protein